MSVSSVRVAKVMLSNGVVTHSWSLKIVACQENWHGQPKIIFLKTTNIIKLKDHSNPVITCLLELIIFFAVSWSQKIIFFCFRLTTRQYRWRWLPPPHGTRDNQRVWTRGFRKRKRGFTSTWSRRWTEDSRFTASIKANRYQWSQGKSCLMICVNRGPMLPSNKLNTWTVNAPCHEQRDNTLTEIPMASHFTLV